MGRNNQNSKWATHQQINPKRSKPVVEKTPSKAVEVEYEVEVPEPVKPVVEPKTEAPAPPAPEPVKPVQDLKPLSKKKATE